MQEPALRLLCHQDEFDDLLGDLALHRLDVVLADRAAPHNTNLRLYSHALGTSALGWYAAAPWLAQARRGFPQSLERVPVLLPTAHAAVRSRLDRWFEQQGVQPRIVGEFEDSALLAVFAARGLGVFPVSRLGATDVGLMRGLRLLGRCDDVKEEIHAIRSRRGQHHPLVLQVVAAARS